MMLAPHKDAAYKRLQCAAFDAAYDAILSGDMLTAYAILERASFTPEQRNTILETLSLRSVKEVCA